MENEGMACVLRSLVHIVLLCPCVCASKNSEQCSSCSMLWLCCLPLPSPCLPHFLSHTRVFDVIWLILQPQHC